jgi:hypothetical protein
MPINVMFSNLQNSVVIGELNIELFLQSAHWCLKVAITIRDDLLWQ